LKPLICIKSDATQTAQPETLNATAENAPANFLRNDIMFDDCPAFLEKYTHQRISPHSLGFFHQSIYP